MITKLDVLDALERLQLCVGYRSNGITITDPPLCVEAYAGVEPIYEEMPGWGQSTVGVTSYSALPLNARRYLERIEALAEVPIDMISTGPERDQTIIRRHSFA